MQKVIIRHRHMELDHGGSPTGCNKVATDISTDFCATVATIGWQVTWSKAFPTLLAFDVYCDEAAHLCVIAYQEIIRHKKHQQSANRQDHENAESIECWSDSLGYGEITCETVFQLISWLQEFQQDFCPARVMDLGSGNGRVILASSIAYPFEQLIGMEIVPHLHDDAMEYWRFWSERYICPTLLTARQQRIEYKLADFTLDPSRIHNSDFIWIHATVFGPNLILKLQELCEGCKSGTYFVVISMPLKVGGGIVTIKECLMDMSWGKARVFIQKRNDQASQLSVT